MSLEGQHWQHEMKTTGAAERGLISAKTQNEITSQGLAGYQRCLILPGPFLCPGNQPDRTHE